MPYGIDQSEWDAAVQAITSILAHRAKTMIDDETIPYSDLFNQIRDLVRSAPLTGPEDHRFHLMLGEVSTAEHNAGRGMLTVLVVHKTGDMKPGPGFFELARQLGHIVTDEDVFWINQFKKVCSAWR